MIPLFGRMEHVSLVMECGRGRQTASVSGVSNTHGKSSRFWTIGSKSSFTDTFRCASVRQAARTHWTPAAWATPHCIGSDFNDLIIGSQLVAFPSKPHSRSTRTRQTIRQCLPSHTQSRNTCDARTDTSHKTRRPSVLSGLSGLSRSTRLKRPSSVLRVPLPSETAPACETMASSSAAAAALLGRQLKEMQTGKDIPGISCGLVNDSNIFEWEVMLMISDDCKYYGGTVPLLCYTCAISSLIP